MKRCSNCKVEKSLSDFNRNRAAKDGHQNWCRDCYHEKFKATFKPIADLSEADQEQHRRRHRDLWCQRKYGMTLAQLEEMAEAQGWQCAICRQRCKLFGARGEQLVFNVDHCHLTQRVRGLLCQPCNHGIARLGDSEERVQAAAEYLRRRSGEDTQR